MRDDLRSTGATASFAASLSMALLAAVALANAGSSASSTQLAFVALVAVAAATLSALLLRISAALLRSHRQATSQKPALVPIPVRERYRRTR